ncbi:MAG: DUF362 domain-containing protein [Firmicutes bacterium]|nr:DUF362 domain-containing protein [Bacillota bacterium]
MRSIVALVRCDTYEPSEVKKAVAKAIDALGGFEAVFAAREVADTKLPALTRESPLILKPNLLAKAPPEKAVTTHPAVFRAAAELLQEAGYNNLKYGDSPGNPIYNTEKTAETCGIKAVADQLRIPVGNFEHGQEVACPDGRVTKKFVLCKEVADNPYGVIDLCKMKTHQLERITGAVKNTFGCIYGVNKAASHAKHMTAETFAKMLADLNRIVIPRLHIMDGIMAMEGNGPGSGDPIPMNVILASTDPVALDTTFCHLIDLNTDLVPTQTAAVEAGLGVSDDDSIKVIAIDVPMIPDGTELTFEEVARKCGNSKFNVQRGASFHPQINALRPFERWLEKKPSIIWDRCIGCGVCIDTCPLEDKALRFGDDGAPKYDYSKCIKCYCCQEMCPEKAIHVRRSFLARLADRNWKW